MELFRNIPAIHIKTRAAWRKWLEKNHDKASSVWLIFYRKGAETSSVNYVDAVEEALCFGWIDSVKYPRDGESSYQYFAPRKPKGTWAKTNKERVERMMAQGLMTPAGQVHIDAAKKNGAWETLTEVDNMTLPPDLLKLFKSNKIAFSNFEKFSPSSKKVMLQWIVLAKRPETREKRIEAIVASAAENKKAYP